MFRFTEAEEKGQTVFVIEGRLAGPAVAALEEVLLSLEQRGHQVPVLVDLMGVTAMDAAGKGLLAELHAHGATLRAKGCLNRAIVQEITASGRRTTPSGDVPREGEADE
jgi:anti-anti-sigma regulatory factor